MDKEARDPDDLVFGQLIPDEYALRYIQQKENNGWELVATRAGDDMSALKLHESLAVQGEMFHYQLSATRFGTWIGLNLYFLKRLSQESRI